MELLWTEVISSFTKRMNGMDEADVKWKMMAQSVLLLCSLTRQIRIFSFHFSPSLFAQKTN